MPVDLGLCRRTLGHTQSNTLLISIITDLTSNPSPRALQKTFTRT